MHKPLKNYICVNILYWFTAATKITSMFGGNANGCWICQSEQGPPLF